MKNVAVAPDIYPDPEALSRAAAIHVLESARAAIAARGVFHVALAGGSTPRRLYELLAAAAPGQTDWSRWQVWFGDERCVPRDHADSNYRMARQALLDHVVIPADHIHPMVRDPAHPEADAAAYAEALAAGLPQGDHAPVFDLVLLGMGDDGHTASLFPGTAILDVHDRHVAAVHVAAKDSWRISLTYPVLGQARELLFLVAGASKAPVIAQVLGQPDAAPRYPVERIAAIGTVHWLLDSAAAGGLTAC
ncbi:MAG TPA: 6-phosphogluconolactonase [Thioalkalivibrio sp.]|nr:6-phosphogluconolactonase [Thioalkalivibrio sp.]